MAQEKSESSEPSVTHDKWDSCVSKAREIGEAPCRSRHGFGSLRHHDDIFRHSIELVVQSGLIARTGFPFGSPDWFFDGPFFHRRFGRGYPHPSEFFLGLLGSPRSYQPEPLWALFWAMAAAEHQFLSRFVPYWSHEERLTGHFVSLMIERLTDFGVHWRALDGSDTNDRSRCDLYYADTATARQESTTGADLGLILHCKFGMQDEFWKVARFQAKKVGRSGQAQIDLDQTEALIQQESLGYYLFYHAWAATSWSLMPTVTAATQYASAVKEHREKRAPRGNLGTVSLPTRGSGFDFATFITFGLADQASEVGVVADDPEHAMYSLTGRNLPSPVPSRIVVITLGSPSTSVNWDRVLREYVRRGGQEE